jgi:hypothetical protein
MRLYYHKTDGGAEYLFDTFIECPDGHKEGTINGQTKYIVRIDGDITKDAELTVKGVNKQQAILEECEAYIAVNGNNEYPIDAVAVDAVVENVKNSFGLDVSDNEEFIEYILHAMSVYRINNH